MTFDKKQFLEELKSLGDIEVLEGEEMGACRVVDEILEIELVQDTDVKTSDEVEVKSEIR